MRRWRWETIVVLPLLFCVVLVYHGALRGDFLQWDDDVLIYNNPHVTGLNVSTLRWLFGTFDYVVRYQPLTWLTWAAVVQSADHNPWAFHLANLIFHSLNTFLVFLIIRELLLRKETAMLEERRAKYLAICSGLGALAWAIHPMRAEVVAWASALLHCQALFFLLLSVLCYLKADARNSPALRPRVLYWVSFASYVASLLSYPIGLGFVAVLVALDVWVLGRFRSGEYWWRGAESRRLWIEKLPFLGAAVLVVAIALWARVNVRAGWSAVASMEEFGFGHRVMQACYIWAYYLWKPWVPFDLAPVYTTLLSFRPTDAAFIRSLMLLLGLTVVLVTQRRRFPTVLALWITHLSLLVPVLGLTEHPHYPSDRYSYVVSILWSVALGAGLFALAQRPGCFVPALGGCLALAGILGVMSEQQTRIWHSSETLFRYTIAQLGDDPYRADIHLRLGMVLADEGKLDEAVVNYRIALGIIPAFADAHHYLAIALERQQKTDEALQHYLEALRLIPDYPEAHGRVGLIFAERGRKAEAIAHLQRALVLDPTLPGLREKLSGLLGEK